MSQISGTGDRSDRSWSNDDLRTPEQIQEVLSLLIPELQRLVSSKSDEALRQPDHDGLWSILDIMSHLLDWERIFQDRIVRILHETMPELPAHDDSLWSVEHNYRENNPETVLEELTTLRTHLLDELSRLPEPEWDTEGILEGKGVVSVRWILHALCNHDRKHVEQAQQTLA